MDTKKRQYKDILYGKIPSQSAEHEGTVLGTMMLEPETIPIVLKIIQTPHVFYKEENKIIFEAISLLYKEGITPTFIDVTAKLRETNKLELVGGSYYVTSLTRDVVNGSASIEKWARRLIQHYTKREINKIGINFVSESTDDTTDFHDILEDAEKIIKDVKYNIKHSYHKNISAICNEYIQALEDKIKNKDEGVKLYISEIDEKIKGFQGGCVYVIAARTSMGKCLSKGTKVVMFDGSLKNVEDIKKGDALMGIDSKPRNVLSLARGREMMYWVRQKRGIDYRVNESHILSLKMSGNFGSIKTGDIINISVKDFLSKPNSFKTNLKGYKTEIDFKEQEVIIPPYILGVWLGDGKTDSSQIFNVDKEVHEELYKYSELNKNRLSHIHPKDRCESIRICGTNSSESLLSKLKSIGVIGNKHIPNNYIYNSKKNRLEILAGILDSDGYYTSEFNCFEVTQKSELFANQIKYICDTLGFRTSIVKKCGQIASTGFKGYYFRVRISGNLDIIPTRIKRKQARPYVSKRDWRVTGINIEKDIVDDYYGFEIDGDKLFLLEDMTVTHNTAFEISCSLEQSKHIAVGIWNGELTPERFVRRCLSNLTRRTVDEMRSMPNIEKDTEGVELLMNLNIVLDNTPNIYIDELVLNIKYWVEILGVKIVWIDYLQVIRLSEQQMRLYRTRAEQIAFIIDQLNEVSKECNIPIILLAQLNREVMKIGDKRPNLSHLRDSGSVEERVYHVGFLHRPEYYGEDEHEGQSTKNMLQYLIRKNGDGENPCDINLSHELMYNVVLSREEIVKKYEFIDSETPF